MVLVGSTPWRSQHRGFVVHGQVIVVECHRVDEAYRTTVHAELPSCSTVSVGSSARQCCPVRSSRSLDFDGPLSRRDVCCPVVVFLIVACLDHEGHPLPSTAASLAPFVAHLHVLRLSVEQVSEDMAWRSSRVEVVLTESMVSLADWRPMIASVDPACATPLRTLSKRESESRRGGPSIRPVSPLCR